MLSHWVKELWAMNIPPCFYYYYAVVFGKYNLTFIIFINIDEYDD